MTTEIVDHGQLESAILSKRTHFGLPSAYVNHGSAHDQSQNEALLKWNGAINAISKE